MEPIKLHWFQEAGCYLYAPASFLVASEKEIAEVCNGCGTKGFSGWLVPETMWGLRVSLVCNIHDWTYQLCQTEEDEDLADCYFKSNLRRFIRTRSLDEPWLTKLRLARANVYFAAVALTYYAPALQEKIKR